RHPLGPDILDPQYATVREANPVHLASRGGRSSCGTLPFFNIAMGEQGIIGAIGWTGDWAARFWREENGSVTACAGMKRTHLTLHPGEEIRSPRILLFFWEDDITEAHNQFRRLILAHHTPRPNGEPLRVPISFSVWGENHAEQQLGKIRWLAEHQIPVDNFWIDAGWHGDAKYQDGSNVFNSAWWSQVGNWWPNTVTYPNGLAPIGEAAKNAGMRFTVWLEPERVFKGTQFTREHPEWLLGPIGDNCLFNLGDPVACQALTTLISQQLSAGQITCYRQDFNTDPAPFWEAADAPNRVGIHEIRYIEGLYAFWDALLEQHPGLIIDNCSSGGRRIDLETISRSVPLWRSDYQCFPDFDPAGMQGQLQGLAPWVPLSAGCGDHQDTYAFRSAFSPGMTIFTMVNPTTKPEGYYTPEEAFDVAWLRQHLKELQTIQPYFSGDFYPLLSYSLANDVWAAWQLNRPDLGEGMLLAFRRKNSPFSQMTATLHGLDPQAEYEFRDMDTGETQHCTGEALMTHGMPITIATQPGSILLTYHIVHLT
ncbi:MAG TPA: alpha-galactosidase, partial [Armatimonadota bacterium]|nr:alpha-galactosidase [Armatimonadota bacterium]